MFGYVDDVSRELFEYLPPLTKRDDFDAFWNETIAKAYEQPLNATFKKVECYSEYADVYEVSYNGFDSTVIHGLFIVPKFGDKVKPCVIHFHGFTGSCGLAHEFMSYVMAGVCVLSIDCRDQGGKTGNHAHYSSGMCLNVVSKGILDKAEYYYRAVYMDCKKAIDVALLRTEVDKSQIIIEGGSQGGALAMAVSALDERVFLCLCDVPSNSHLVARVEGRHGSFASVTEYLTSYPQHTEKAFETLSYFDTMNLADLITCEVFASVGLKDNICPARMYFATYNRIKSKKEISCYPFNGHEGGHVIHEAKKLAFIKSKIV